MNAIENRIRRFWREEKPSWWFWVQFFAPFFLLAFAGLRSYAETALLSSPPAFSFYRTAHHVLWFASAMMTVVLWLHLLSKIPLADLLWVFYGIVGTGIPLLVAWASGDTLALEYHHGPVLTVIRDVLTFSFFQPHNRPIAIELVIIAVGFFGISYLCILEWKKSLLSTAVFLLTLNLYAVAWLSPEGTEKGYFHVASALSPHPFLAVLFLGTLCLVTLAYLWRTGVASGDRFQWAVSAAMGLVAWAVYAYAAGSLGWFSTPWDRVATGLPVATAAVLATRVCLWGWGRGASPWALVLVTGLLFAQVIVTEPIFLGTQERFVSRPRGRLTMEPGGDGPALAGPEAFPRLLTPPAVETESEPAPEP